MDNRQTMSSERMTLIADAAIALLGELGARGLTHRAVDAHAGLPPGSTSAYCRSRIDLLSVALKRHAELDLADLDHDAQQWMSAPVGLDAFVDALVARIETWLLPANRQRLVARFELFLIASRTPELGEVVARQREQFFQLTLAALQHLKVPNPMHATPALMAMVDAVLFGQIGRQSPPFDATLCRDTLRHMVMMRTTSV
jgi:DNA-binding transcriptional regulator YbjK